MSRGTFWFLGFSSLLFGSVTGGCHESSGTQLNSLAQAQSAASERPQPRATESPSVTTPLVPPAGSASEAVPATAAAPLNPSPEGEAAPELLDADGKPLPQTEERPALSSPSFQKRVAAVAQAIVSGDAEPALGAFFPLVAYQQVKDVAKPERDYKFRLLANFKRDVIEYHHALGSAAAQAKFDGVTVSEKDAKWQAPGAEGNKVGYFRVLRSRLRFTLPTGRSREFELTSMISWRGQWYVVHLHGFK